MKKVLLIPLLFLHVLMMFSQKKELKIFENKKNWNREIIQFPIEWAPKFNLIGFEELLFTPNWNKPKNKEYWSLIIGWKINTEQLISLAEIESNFRGYFDGLMKPNHWSKEFPEPKVSFHRDKKDFIGTMTFFDGFHTGKVITVNIRGNQKFDKPKKKSIIKFRISPQQFDQPIWNTLNKIKITEPSTSILNLGSSWGKERFPFPINFAPEINYNGIAEVRFPPKGWRDPNHENFWSYTFAWKIKLEKPITPTALANNLELYFDGLNNLKHDKNLANYKAVANIIKIKSLHNNDLFIGKVKTYDRFATNNELELNVLIETHDYPTKKQSIVHFKFSPKYFGHKTWVMLSKIELNKNQ